MRPIQPLQPIPAIPTFPPIGNQRWSNNGQNNGPYRQQARPSTPRPQPQRHNWNSGSSWENNGQPRPKWGNYGFQTGQQWSNEGQRWPNQGQNQPNELPRPK